jgi:membrane protein YqaA with SNARE-associated domain
MPDILNLWGLFLSAFISSTLFPGGSEVALGVLAARQQDAPWSLLTIATAGNTLGAMTTWLLGNLLARRLSSTANLSAGQRRAVERAQKWGSPILLLSWLPVVGDPLCFAAGYLRLPFVTSLLFIAIGKAARYAAILLALG